MERQYSDLKHYVDSVFATMPPHPVRLVKDVCHHGKTRHIVNRDLFAQDDTTVYQMLDPYEARHIWFVKDFDMCVDPDNPDEYNGLPVSELVHYPDLLAAQETSTQDLPFTLNEDEEFVVRVTWPGYEHVEWKVKYDIYEPGCTLGKLATAVATMFCAFFLVNHNRYLETEGGGGVRLGPGGVTFDRIFIRKLYRNSEDDEDDEDDEVWDMEMAYVVD